MSKIFIEYPSIENHYREKHIEKWLNKFPQLLECEYILQEKLHGTNIQIIFNPNQSEKYVIASRNRCIPSDESFFGIREVLKEEKYQAIFDFYSDLAGDINQVIRLYGELIGEGVQKGIDYGEKKLKIFDVSIDGVFACPTIIERTFKHFYSFGLTEEAKVFSNIGVKVSSLKEALEYDCEKETAFGNGICEGVVIKPISDEQENLYSDEFLGRVFYLKKKNEKFMEKPAKKKHSPESVEVFKMREIFKTYINENRLNSVFSKEGVITSEKDFGKYIKLTLMDAKEDFLKDYEGEHDKRVFKCEKEVVHLLRKHL